MITLTSAMIAQKNTMAGTSEGPWVWLCELWRDSTNVLRYARAQENVTFDSQTWTANNLVIEPPSSDNRGTSKAFTIAIQNVDQTMVTYLEAGELRNQAASLYLVHADLLSAATNVVTWRGVILEAEASYEYCSFSIGSYDIRAGKVPASAYSATRCRWRFKSQECGYSGGQTSCDKRYTTCNATMSNVARFGGFPTLPWERP